MAVTRRRLSASCPTGAARRTRHHPARLRSRGRRRTGQRDADRRRGPSRTDRDKRPTARALLTWRPGGAGRASEPSRTSHPCGTSDLGGTSDRCGTSDFCPACRARRAGPHNDAVPVAIAVHAAVRAAIATRPPSGSSFPRRDLPGERLGPGRDRGLPFGRQIGEQRDLLATMVDTPCDEEDLAIAPGRRRLFVQPREDHDLDASLEILEGDDRHRGLRLRDHRPHPVTMPPTTIRWPSRDSSFRSLLVGGDEPSDLLGDLAHRVLREYRPRSSFSQRNRSRTGTSVAAGKGRSGRRLRTRRDRTATSAPRSGRAVSPGRRRPHRRDPAGSGPDGRAR